MWVFVQGNCWNIPPFRGIEWAIHSPHLAFFGDLVGHHEPVVIESVLVEFLGVELCEGLVFCVLGVCADFPVKSWLELSDEWEAFCKFFEEDVCVWVLYVL